MRTLGCILVFVIVFSLALAGVWYILKPAPPVPAPQPSKLVEAPSPEPPQRGLPAETPDVELLTTARELLGHDGRRDDCGPYSLYTDIPDPTFAAVCTRLATALDDLYEQRYGIRPRGEPAEAIVLFSEISDYRTFSKGQNVPLGYAGYALGPSGLAVFYTGDQTLDGFLPTFAHEITHLLNRRALGANLPRWLSEGLADGVGDSATVNGFGPLDGEAGDGLQAGRLRTALTAGRVGSIQRLVSLKRSEFDTQIPSYDYEQSALLVRFLLADPALVAGFRRFLGEIARGGIYDPEGLREDLGIGWEELDQRFSAWVLE